VTFVDTGAWVALFVEADTQHRAAQARISSNRDRLVTSDYIVDEVLTLIGVRIRRQTAVRAGEVLFGRIWIFRSHGGERWGFTDCTSLALMRRMEIANAFRI
jgi:predicted nucleic acid-binding protein